MEKFSHDSTNPGLYNRPTSPNQTFASRLPVATPQHFAPTPPPGLGLPQWPPNEDGHVCEFTNIFRRCPHCSWSARMHNPRSNTHYDRPAEFERKYIQPALHPPPGWPAGIPWTVPYGTVERKQHPEGFRPFDPRCMLWWSQWEIVFARAEMDLSDTEICALYRYRWAVKDPTTRFMQPHHVPEILNLLCDNHPWHAHAFWFRGKERELMAREEWQQSSNKLMVAKDQEWDARCQEWEATAQARLAMGEEWKIRTEALAERTKILDAQTTKLDARRRKLEVERWELAPKMVALRVEFSNDLARAMRYDLYIQGANFHQ